MTRDTLPGQSKPLAPGGTEHPEGLYGCRQWFPRALQCLNNVRAHVFFHCLFNFFEGFIANGVINVIVSALEKRYKLSSARAGLVVSGNDFGAFPLLLFVGYFMEGRRKPLWMALGVLLMALGSGIFVLPHFLGGTYHYTVTGGTNNSGANLCAVKESRDTCDAEGEEPASLYGLFLLGQVLLGIGAVPMFTVGLTYIDENAKPKMTSFYTGLIYASAAAGVAVGYVTAGHTLSLFVDFNTVDSARVPLTPSDPQWVGAWWVCVLVACCAFLLIGLPLCGYPQHMPGFNRLRQTRLREEKEETTVPVNGIRHFPKSLLVLLRNPTFLLLCLGGTFDALIISGTATFGAKLLQQFFQIDLAEAGTIMGVITVPGAGGGMLLGGWLVKRWALQCRGILRMCMTFTLLSLLLSPSFFAYCERTPLAGLDLVNANGTDDLDSSFANSSFRQLSLRSSSPLTSQCNRACNCDTKGMEPVCLQDSLVFFSPCYAGCTAVLSHSSTKLYVNCSCATLLERQGSASDTDQPQQPLVPGSCVRSCALKYVFCFLFFCIMVCTFATMSPNITAVMRCVPYGQRSQAIGLQLLAARLAGTTPGPVLFGVMVDSACSLWQEGACLSRGACWVYDQRTLATRVILWWVTLKVCGALSYAAASLLYRPPRDHVQQVQVCVSQVTSP